MANFLRTVLVQNRAEPADRVFVEQLPVNPISQILVTLRGVVTVDNVSNGIQSLFASIPAVAMAFRGQDIFRGSLQDLAVVNALVCGSPPFGSRFQDGAGVVWSLTVPLCLGRRPYLVKECFPAVRRGDLVLEVQVDTATANVDLVDVQIETVELLDETPEQYLKYVTGQLTFSSTGEQDVRLPIGNPLLGVLLWGTTWPQLAVQTATWERLRLKVDNVEALYARANWATLHGELGRRLVGSQMFLDDHRHVYDGAAAGFGLTLNWVDDSAVLAQYVYLDFDPLMDGSFMLETAGRADVVIHRDGGTADAARFIPMELVKVAGGGSVGA